MTQNTIDLAIAALNLNSPSDTTSPGNTGICAGKPPFGKSLQEAMQTTDMNSVSGECDAEQTLPPAGQELPLESAYNVGLEGVTEVRALVDAISSITRGADQLRQQANSVLDISGVTSLVAESPTGIGAITDVDSLIDQLDEARVASSPHTSATSALRSASGFDPSTFEEGLIASSPRTSATSALRSASGFDPSTFEEGLIASSPHTSATSALRSASGFDPSSSEEANFDLRQTIGASSGASDENINRQLGSFNGTLSSGFHESRITISDAVSITETTNSKDNSSRSLSLDPGLGLSSVTQAESKFVNRANAIEVPQQPLMTKSAEVVSSNELATHLRVLKSSGGGEARLQLHPAELGRMTVSLIMEGDEARVSFVVENSQAKQAVEVSLPRLRDLMDEAGLSLTDAEVSDRHSKENENQRAERVMEETTANSGNDAEDFEESNSPSSSQLVDTFA